MIVHNLFRGLCLAGVAGSLALATASDAAAQISCEATETVRPGESLSEIAERCGVRLGDIFNANPELRSVSVPPGTNIVVPVDDDRGMLDRARSALTQAGDQIEDAASRAGKSVSDYLSSNPDLNRDILAWGERVGLPGVSAPAAGGAAVALSHSAGRPGDRITINAVGLRGGIVATIGAQGPDGEPAILHRIETDRTGSLKTTITVPETAEPGQPLLFFVETDRVRVTSDPFEVTRPPT